VVAARDDDLVVCDGDWDISRADELASRVTRGLARGAPILLLDFRPATFVDASTVGAICTFSRELSQLGVALAVVCGPGFARRVFDLTHLGDVVPVAATVEEAMHAASSRASEVSRP
jgi:anti-anti-sigma factor